MQFNRGFIRAGAAVLAIATAGIGFTDSLSAQGGVPDPDGFRYYWPGSCVEAVYRSNSFYWRDKQDSLRFSVPTDTILTPSATLARECLAKLNIADVQFRDRVPLIAVYLAAGDDKGANVAAAQALAAAQSLPVLERGLYQSRILQTYLFAKPNRLDRAKVILGDLDNLTGEDGAVGRLVAYSALARFYSMAGDVSNLTGASERVVALGKEISSDERIVNSSSILTAYRYLAQVAGARTGDSAAALAVLSRASRDIGELPNMSRYIRNFQAVFRGYGSKAARVVADQWVLAPGDTIFPVQGRMMLLISRPYRTVVPGLNRVAKKYQDRLDLVATTGTNGYYKNLGPLEHSVEAGHLRKQFAEDFKFFGSVSLSYTEFNRLPDGRREADPNPNENRYRIRNGAFLTLVDKEGIIRQVWMRWDPWVEAELEKAIEQWSAPSQ